jgi:hypothetical protein
MNKTELYKQDLTSNKQIWFNDDNGIILYEVGVLHNLITNEYLRLRLFIDNTQHISSSCDGLKTILIREYTSIQGHKLRRVEANDFITGIEIGETTESYLYPNPTTETINLSFINQHASNFHYEVISTSGQVVQSASLGYLQLEVNSIDLDISSIANGKYLLRVFSDREEFVFNVIKGE